MKNYYTAEEAIRRLNIPRSTFYYLIKQGDLPEGIIIPLRKQALYPKKDIDEIANLRARMLGEFDQEPERFMFAVPDLEELEQLVEVDRMVFHGDTLIPPDEQYKWLKYNPEAIHILKDTKIKEVVGGVTISPLKEEAIRKLIKLEIDETGLVPEEFVPFRENEQQDCYVIGIVAKPNVVSKYYASQLIRSVLDYLIELLERGVNIRYMYTVTGTEEGEELAKNLHFKRLLGDRQGEHEFRHPYVINLQEKDSPSRIVRAYIKSRKNIERRAKRQRKQH